MALLKNTAYYFVKVVTVAIMACLIVVCMFFGYLYYCNLASMQVPTLGPFQIYIVLSDSMAPYIVKDDAVVVSKADPEKLKQGDIITFTAFESDVTITHRIINVEKTDQGYEFRTQGDNNNTEDSFVTTEDRIIGKYFLKIPKLQSFMNITIQRPYAIAVIVGVVILIQFLLGLAEKALKPGGEDEESEAKSGIQRREQQSRVIQKQKAQKKPKKKTSDKNASEDSHSSWD